MATSPATPAAPGLDEIDISEGSGVVTGTIDNNHRRSRGLVGSIVKITSAYYGEEYRRQHPRRSWNFRLVAFVPANNPKDDRWCF